MEGGGEWCHGGNATFLAGDWFGHGDLSASDRVGVGLPRPVRVTEQCRGDGTPGPARQEGLITEKTASVFVCPSQVYVGRREFWLARSALLKIAEPGLFISVWARLPVAPARQSRPSALGLRRASGSALMCSSSRCGFPGPRRGGRFNKAGCCPQGEA